MARSRVCPGCATDLAAVAPVREPHYGLLLEFCPRCGRAMAARRESPGRAARLAMLRVVAAATLVIKIVVLALLMSAVVEGAIAATLKLEYRQLDPLAVLTTGRVDALREMIREWDWQ